MFKGIADWYRQRVARRAAYRRFKAQVARLGLRAELGDDDEWPIMCHYCRIYTHRVKTMVRVQPPVGASDLNRVAWKELLTSCCYLCGSAMSSLTNKALNLFEFLDDLEHKQNPYSVVVRRLDEIQQELHQLEQRRTELITELERQRQEKQRLELEAPQSYRKPPLLAE